MTTIQINHTSDKETLLFLDIDGVLCPFRSLPDHWRQIFWRNYWTKIGRFDVVKELISEEKKEILAKMLSSLEGKVQIIISSDWRKTIPEDILAQTIGQSQVQKTPYTQRNIVNPLDWKQWYNEATHKKQLRIKQIETFCSGYTGKIGRIIVIDDSSVVPLGYQVQGVDVEFIQPKSSEGLLSKHLPNK